MAMTKSAETRDHERLAPMFAAGALSVAEEHGMAEKEAMSLVKEAAERIVVRDDYDDDDDSTWWSRNKGWALPSAVGLGMFLLGANSAKDVRYGNNHFYNAGNWLWNKAKALLGVPSSTYLNRMAGVDEANWKRMVAERNSIPDPEGSEVYYQD